MKIIIYIVVLLFVSGCEMSSSSTKTQEENIVDVNISTELSFRSVIDERFSVYDESIWLKSDWANGTPFYNAWCPSQVDINDGILSLNLEQLSCNFKSYGSGEYRTLSSYMYGRYSSRFQASDINGTISSFFTYTGAAEGTEWDEIDVEILGKDTTKMQVNYWRDGHEHPFIVDLGFNAAISMHTYSFVFTPDFIKWYVDDKLVYSVMENNLSNEDSLPVNAGKIIVNLWAATGIDSWSGKFIDGKNSSSSYEFITFEELQ